MYHHSERMSVVREVGGVGKGGTWERFVLAAECCYQVKNSLVNKFYELKKRRHL